jgi:hypothetical protein
MGAFSWQRSGTGCLRLQDNHKMQHHLDDRKERSSFERKESHPWQEQFHPRLKNFIDD